MMAAEIEISVLDTEIMRELVAHADRVLAAARAVAGTACEYTPEMNELVAAVKAYDRWLENER